MNRLLEILHHPRELPKIVRWRTECSQEFFQRFWSFAKQGGLREAINLTVYELPSIDLSCIAPTLMAKPNLILEHVCMPPYEGPTTHDDLTPLIQLVMFLKPQVVLELGTGRGATVANICNNSRAHVVTINALPEQISGKITTYTLTTDQIGSVYRKHGFENRVTQIFANTLAVDFSPYFERSLADLAIIDACHDEKFVLNDFNKVLPILAPKATVLFHDTHPCMRDHLVGSYKACAALRSKGYNIKHIKNTWWAIWQRV